jgi:hypothetical protein
MYDITDQFLGDQIILPAQFFPGHADHARIEPLRRLAFAVLTDAIHCFQSNFGARKPRAVRLFAEAREWLLGPGGDGPFSFENVCYLVDVDAARLRQVLRHWQERRRAGLPCRTLVRRSPVSRPGSLQPRRSRARHARQHAETLAG